ncbi:MAG: cysteine desulfurase [Rikenellaceae bacterium]|jgi:cysteine desulfurase/selenocysteine lyase|nr:cysteine desulfurase [Rikenellaceae bacterium]
MDINKIRDDFDILSRRVYGRPLIYLDSGATAQKPRRVIETIDRLYREVNANVHRGTHFLSERMTEEYESARAVVQGFIGAHSPNEVVFTSGATMAINLVAYSFGEKFVQKGDNVIVSEMEHHSNIVPWQLLCQRKGAHLRVIPFADDGTLLIDRLTELIDARTRIVAVTQASNTLGTRPDLPRIIDMAHHAGVPVLVDGCQGIVHGGVDVKALDCDFYAFSAHKLYGPTGIGALYAKAQWLEAMPPFLGGGDMVGTVTFDETTYAAPPLKFEAGTPNFVGAVGMAEAIRYIQTLDAQAVAAHEEALLRYATERLLAIDGVRIYGQTADKCSIVSFTAEGAHPYDIGMMLDKTGVAIRTGQHCAEPVMSHYGVTAMARASFALYNTCEEVDALADGLIRVLALLRG